MVSVGISRGGDGLVCTSWAQTRTCTRLVMLAANPELNLLLISKSGEQAGHTSFLLRRKNRGERQRIVSSLRFHVGISIHVQKI